MFSKLQEKEYLDANVKIVLDSLDTLISNYERLMAEPLTGNGVQLLSKYERDIVDKSRTLVRMLKKN